MMTLFDHQKLAVEKLKTGSVLVGGVGSGKSRTSLAYFYSKVCKGDLNDICKSPEKVMDLYIITTARKRDTKEWEAECIPFIFQEKGINVTVDSWNNIGKYEKVRNCFFIFDEQRVVGYGTWARTFIKITKSNPWILLSATPGDKWEDYIAVFIANNFYKNKYEFIKQHVVYKPFMNFPVIDHYVGTKVLEKHRNDILVTMKFERKTTSHYEEVMCEYDKKRYFEVVKNRWNVFKDEPIINSSEFSQTLRHIANEDYSRIKAVVDIVKKSLGVIIFYNFNYELEKLEKMCQDNNFEYAQWNGHKHQSIPESKSYWVYLVQYNAGAEGWNCITTNTIIFYSQNHSYKMMTQAAGRIDRLNTPFSDLYYYTLLSNSGIDKSIKKCLQEKKDFNENKYTEDYDEFEEFY